MAWTTTKSFVVGAVGSSSDFNTYAGIGGNTAFLATPPTLYAYRNGAYSFNGSGATMPLDTVLFDSASGFNVSTHVYTVQVQGMYFVVGEIACGTDGSAGHVLWPLLSLNGNLFAIGQSSSTEGGGSPSCQVFSSPYCYVNDALLLSYSGNQTGAALLGTVFNWLALSKMSN